LAQLELSIQKHFPSTDTSPGFDLDISLECDAGVTVLFGASGSGKTLTLDSLAGFLRPDRGRILLNNEILFDAQSEVSLPPQRRGLGYVFQNYALFPHMTVEQNLAFGVSRLPALERHSRVREMLDLFGLTTLGSRLPQELSGGEKQRASIARALIPQPRLLLLDEPARGLDYQLRLDFYAVLHNIRAKYRIPILLVTHDVTEGFMLADRMAVYGAGRIIQTGEPDEVFLHPRNAAVARLLGISNIFSGTVEELDPMADSSLIRTGLFLMKVPYLPGRLRGDTVSFCIPRENVQLVQPAGAGDLGRENRRENQIPARVIEEITTPSTVRLLLDVQGDNAKGNGKSGPLRIESEISRAVYKRMGIATQKDWVAALPKAFIHVFPEQAG
jgi:molybdate transport system ATP-binding protein